MHYEQKIYNLLNEAKLKPSFTKKAQAILKKELGSDIEVKKTYDGAVLKASGKSHGINIDYQDHALYGDTFEIYPVDERGYNKGTGADIEQNENENDALKGIAKLAKKYKKLLQK